VSPEQFSGQQDGGLTVPAQNRVGTNWTLIPNYCLPSWLTHLFPATYPNFTNAYFELLTPPTY